MDDKSLRTHVLELLSAKNAHVDFSAAIDGLAPRKRGVRPAGSPHSPWEIVEHIRIAQWDILEFCRDAKHKSPDWPSGYWPKNPAPPTAAAWTKSVKAISRSLDEMKKLVANPKTDLFAKIPHGTGQTILREALLLADHNAYHVGELVLVRRLLGEWDKS
jgi:DinB superfamily